MRTNRTPASRAVIFSDRKSAGPIRNTVSPTDSTTSRSNGVGDLIARDAAAQSIDVELGFQERRALGSSTAPEYGSLSSFSPAIAVSEGVSARSEEHTSELQSLMRISYAVFCLKKKKHTPQ